MFELAANEKEAGSELAELVTAALSQDSLTGLSEMLKTIALSVESDGCILWEARPGSTFDGAQPKARFFILAGWFRDNWRLTLSDLPLKSAVGKAVLTQQSVNVERLPASPVFMPPVLERTPVKTFFCVPINFVDGTKGALNVYRYDPQPLNESEQRRVEEQAALVPRLYQAIRHTMSLKLIRKVDDILHEAEASQIIAESTTKMAGTVFDRICEQVASAFQCVETSIFLEDPVEAAGQYKLVSTTWPEYFGKRVYRKTAREGLTGWALESNRPVRIFDLSHFKRDKSLIRSEYPGITWKDSLDFARVVREVLSLSPTDDLPPLSFMAAPIAMGDRVLGVIRCSSARPGYLADSELHLLKVVATQIGRYWGNCLNRREARMENESWRRFIESVKRLNQFVHNELSRESPEEPRIFAEALRVAGSVIKGAEIMDVRLLDDSTNELYFAETYGRGWDEGDKHEIQQRRLRRFPVSGEPDSAGSHVFQTKKLYVVHGPDDPYYSETFPEPKRMIIAPISVEDDVFGVLDIRSTKDVAFPRHAEAIAELLGQQLGLYHYLGKTIGKVRMAEADLKRNINDLVAMRKQQAQAFQDLEHQLKSPIIQAYARLEFLLRDPKAVDDKVRGDITKIRGLCGKAKRVAMSTGLFAKLAREEPIQSKLRRVTTEDIVRLAIQAADDNQVMIDPERNITFHVDRASFERPHATRLRLDPDLVEQALNVLLDNAGKYSYPRTQVQIQGGMTGSERFHMTVVNKGLPIRADEVKKCVQRGWRGGLAEATTGEGSGIGLWIVDNIMKAHDGDLVIVPTTSFGITEVKLVFSNNW